MGKLGTSAKVGVVTVLAALGFSVASIASGSPLAAFDTTTTVTTAVATTTTSATITTTTTVVDRRVTLCHKTGSKKRPYVTIKVAQSAVKAHLRHGDALAGCTAKTIKALKAKAHKAAVAKAKAKARAKARGRHK